MPQLKVASYTIKTEGGNFHHPKVKIFVSAKGEFYANLEPEVRVSAEGVMKQRFIEDNKIKIVASSLDKLESLVKEIYRNHYQPEVIKTPVILYNIESHVSFAQDDEGNIFPNATYPNASWKNHEDKRFGNHYSSNPSKGGYSLTIGAQAMLKITYKYGNSEKVSYEPYYKGSSHLGRENPAQKLNSWVSFSLDYENCQEMPYSDEAAEFFYNLLYGMAKISKMIQDNTFEKEKLLQLIATGGNPMLPSPNKE